MTDNEILTLCISSASAVFAGIALGWNIYRDVLARARIDIQVSCAFTSEDKRTVSLCLSFTNLGPTPISINYIASLRRKGLLKLSKEYGFMRTIGIRFHIITSGKERSFETLNPLPIKLDIGDCMSIFLDRECAEMMIKSWERVGVCDSTGRRILCSRRALKNVVKSFLSYRLNN